VADERLSVRELTLGPLRTRRGRLFIIGALVVALALEAILGATGASQLTAGLALLVWVAIVVPLYLCMGREVHASAGR